MNDSEKEQEDHTRKNERRTLIRVLLINFSQALLAGIVGFIAQTTSSRFGHWNDSCRHRD